MCTRRHPGSERGYHVRTLSVRGLQDGDTAVAVDLLEEPRRTRLVLVGVVLDALERDTRLRPHLVAIPQGKMQKCRQERDYLSVWRVRFFVVVSGNEDAVSEKRLRELRRGAEPELENRRIRVHPTARNAAQ